MRTPRSLRWSFLVVVTLIIGAGVYLAGVPAPGAQDDEQDGGTPPGGIRLDSMVQQGTIARNGSLPPPFLLPADQKEALLLKKLEIRRRMAALVDNNPPSPAGLPEVVGQETQVLEAPDARFHGTESDFVFGRNNQNTQANLANGLTSSLAEPAIANNAQHVFAAGNFDHAEFSTDGGLNWTNVPVPGGPALAPFACCDNSVIIDNVRNVTFWSILYIDGGANNGVVRIFVRRNIDQATNCSYDIDPPGDTTLPDFPHLGLSKNFLYLTTNEITGCCTQSAIVRRFSLPEMADCAMTVPTTMFSWPATNVGQRVFVPAENTNNMRRMHWGMHDNTTTFRIFFWPEGQGAPTTLTRAVSASTFGNADCRGGTGDNDWWDVLSASILGFLHRGVAVPGGGGRGKVIFYWPVLPDGSHTQGHIHSAAFSVDDYTVIDQSPIFNNGFCMGLPTVSANPNSDIGIAMAQGGQAGGGGSAASPAVGLSDQFSGGLGTFNIFAVPSATGTHNRLDARYGDYFEIHPHQPCANWFVTEVYALIGGTLNTNVMSRYVEFGRQQSFRCYNAHRSQNPAP